MKTDAQLKQDVLDELTWDPKVDATDIGVIVKDGVVTLTGHLGSYAEKYAAEKAAQRIKGVRVLVTEITFGWQPFSSVRTPTLPAPLSALWTGTRSCPERSRRWWRKDG